ncbi:ABC-2 transporter permease [Clostridium sp. DL1XJH146]
MLFNLVKKDFILVKKYLLFLFIFAVVAPIFITTNINSSGGGFISFFITVLFLEYVIFNTVLRLEDKYKGSSLLCTTPYTRDTLVKAKYLVVLVVFICTYIIYTITTFFTPIGMENIDTYTFGISLLIITICFGIWIPLQYKFGFEKTKYILAAIIFISPFLIPNIVSWLQSTNISVSIISLFSETIQISLIYMLTFLMGFSSIILSVHIYSKKDL